MEKETYCLFAGRHDLPRNLGAICAGFNFDKFEVEKTALWDKMFTSLLRGKCTRLIVTGLTPALCEVLKQYMFHKGNSAQTMGANERHGYEMYPENWPGKLVLLHYNRATGEYQEQVF